MNRNELHEIEESLNEALDLINEAKNLVDNAFSGTSQESHYYAYGRYGFDQLLGNGNPYDTSLETALENLKRDFEEDEENEEDGDL